MPVPLKILFAGSGEFGLPSLRRLRSDGHLIVGVITQPDRPAGRGRGLTPTPVAQFSTDAALPLIRTADLNRETNLPATDLLVVIAFGQKIAEHVVGRSRLGSINLHASRLPGYRGAAPINWAIIRGEAETGNSVIRLARTMDAGEILGQTVVPIGEIETAGELHDRLAGDGAELISRVIAQLADGTALETIQDPAHATLAPKLSRESARIDWEADAVAIARRIRGLSPWPGTRVNVCDAAGTKIGAMRLLRARVLPATEGSRWRPGEVTLEGHVQTGAGVVELIDVQPDGSRSMSLADFRRGRSWVAGHRLLPAD